jgi:hypothetical protein
VVPDGASVSVKALTLPLGVVEAAKLARATILRARLAVVTGLLVD